MKHSYSTKGTCAPKIDFEIDGEGRIHNVLFYGGCKGNRNGISKLVEGMKAEDVIEKLAGIECQGGTSCPDQLAKAIKQVFNIKDNNE